MAEVIVDELEAVQVDEHEGNALFGPPGLLQVLLQPVQEIAAVGQPGEAVVVSHLVELILGLLHDRDVGEQADIAGDFSVFPHDRAHGEPLWVDLAVLPPVPDLPLPASPFSERIPKLLVELLLVLPRLEDPDVLSEDLLPAVPGDRRESAVDVEDPPVGVSDRHAFTGAFEDLGVKEELPFRLLPAGDVQAVDIDVRPVQDGDDHEEESLEPDLDLDLMRLQTLLHPLDELSPLLGDGLPDVGLPVGQEQPAAAIGPQEDSLP